MKSPIRSTFVRGMLVVIATILCACDSDLPMKALPSQIVLESYDAEGELRSAESITDSDPRYARLKKLLAAENGWRKSIVSYKTGPYVVRAGSLIVRIYPEFVVVDSIADRSSVSMRKDVPGLFRVLGLE